MAEENDDLLDPSEIEKLLNSQGADAPADPPAAADASGSESGSAGGDLLDSSDIEKMLQSANSAESGSDAEESPVVNNDDIDALFNQIVPGGSSDDQSGMPISTHAETEALLNQAEANLAAAISPNLGPGDGIPGDLGGTKSFEFPNFESIASSPEEAMALSSLQNVELDLCIELGRTELLIEEVLKMKEGVVVPLDKLAGDPVDILVNGRIIARGEVLVLNDNFCVRVAEIISPEI
ncbi:flagellar motor switch protein FliN [uncultured Gimesia sp.]|uniref:flagellar motor switch protein FliN n=1 Tax=uncultured Gimesia sp. TaxID=1678688 RepID=UPI002611737A|nr:flagellar motor switch protein FliN [uncultured Gimesia sp.]